jgi:murein DD-endopeptidase MepM/ murein hydrolase activator NlpD
MKNSICSKRRCTSRLSRIDLAKDKEEMLASLPAIQPVSNKELKRLSSGYGHRLDPMLKTRRMHWGVDFSLDVGSPVYATGDGKIKWTKSSISGYGKQIELDHGFGYSSKYAHLDMFAVKKGQMVKRGDLIGYSGNTGKSTAPHLHYEVHLNGKKVNPIHYFSRDLSAEEYEEILRLASVENQALGSY